MQISVPLINGGECLSKHRYKYDNNFGDYNFGKFRISLSLLTNCSTVAVSISVYPGFMILRKFTGPEGVK